MFVIYVKRANLVYGPKGVAGELYLESDYSTRIATRTSSSCIFPPIGSKTRIGINLENGEWDLEFMSRTDECKWDACYKMYFSGTTEELISKEDRLVIGELFKEYCNPHSRCSPRPSRAIWPRSVPSIVESRPVVSAAASTSAFVAQASRRFGLFARRGTATPAAATRETLVTATEKLEILAAELDCSPEDLLAMQEEQTMLFASMGSRRHPAPP